MNPSTNNGEQLETHLVKIDQTLRHYLKEITEILAQDGVTEVCINQPCIIWFERNNTWEQQQSAFYSTANLDILFNHIANATKQQFTTASPLISAALETGERVQLVKPPSAQHHSLTIRKPSTLNLSLADLENYGAFSAIEHVITSTPTTKEKTELSHDDLHLLELLDAKNYREFFSFAVKYHKNIIVSGATGSGKTTFTKALIQEIDPTERLITIEDVPELIIPQPNHVRLIYSNGGQSAAKTTPKMLLESCLRMRPDRILLAELRGEEAFYYIRNVNSGHPGSITSIHASSAHQTFDQLMLFIKESEAGNNLSRRDIIHLLRVLIDVVVQYKRLSDGRRVVTEILFDPVARNALSNDMGD